MAKENTAQKAKTKRPKRTLEGMPEQEAEEDGAGNARTGSRQECGKESQWQWPRRTL